MSNIRNVLGLEAIQFSQSKLFYVELTALITKLKAAEDPIKSPVLNRISKLITEHTNIRAKIVVEKAHYINAWVYYPKIERNHPLLEAIARRWSGINAQGLAITKRDVDSIGYVNWQEGKVYGVYQEVDIAIHITTGAINGNYVVVGTTTTLTSAEIAGIILHEVGHVFGYFEHLGSKLTRNIAMITLIERLFTEEKRTESQKILLLTEAKAALNLKGLNVESASTINSKTELQVVLVDAEATRLRSEVGSDLYDIKSFEYVADQYATKQGAGVAVVTALAKMDRATNNDAYMSPLKFTFFETAKLLSFIALSIWSSGIIPLVTIFLGVTINPSTNSYDKPKDRFIRIRQTLVSELANQHSKVPRRDLLDDIALIDTITSAMQTNRTLYEYIFTTLVRSHRHALDQQRIQKDLEAIGMNDIFVSAARLQTLL